MYQNFSALEVQKMFKQKNFFGSNSRRGKSKLESRIVPRYVKSIKMPKSEVVVPVTSYGNSTA